MKKNLLWMLLVIGITVSAFGAYYLHETNPTFRNNQSPENEIGETSENSEKTEPDSPDEAHLWRMLAWRDENGRIPPNAISEALKQRDRYLKQIQQDITPLKADRSKRVSNELLGVALMNWESKGPQNVGGRTRSIIIHPNNPDIIWAGSVGGGVWKSTDGGQSWFAMNGNLQNFAISSMAIDPNNPNILYAGTGEGFFNSDALRGGGIFKTTDGGMTWRLLEGTVPPNPSINSWNWSSVDRISISPNNSNIILVATRGGIMRSVTAGEGNQYSWNNVINTDSSLFVAFDPTNGNKAIAEVRTVNDHRVIYSIDGGLTWTNAKRDGTTTDFQVLGWLKRIELSYSRSSPNVVYALFPIDEGTPPVEVNKIARSTDGGQNFSTTATPSIGASWYNNTLWVSPTDPDFIVGGGYYHYKSTDGGNSFTQISQGYILPPPQQPHVDQHCIVSDSGYNGTTNKRVYVCNDGGIYRTDDITAANTIGDGGWEYISQSYQTSQYYGAAGNGTTGLIYGGTQDNGTLRLLPGSQNANSPYGGDGGFSAVDPTDDSYCYGENIGLRIHRSIDHGVSAQSIYAGITDISDVYGGTTYASFIAPFILDPNQPNRMLAGGASLWRTNNVRGNGNQNDQPTWSKIRANSKSLFKFQKASCLSIIRIIASWINAFETSVFSS